MTEFKDIPLLNWGNIITIKGVIMEDDAGNDYFVLLPMQVFHDNSHQVKPDLDEWYAMSDQLDKCNVVGNEGKILSRGQRQLDQRICWEVYRRDKFKCRYCGIDNVPLTVDHIITWESGGATHRDNLLTSCRKCNKKRGNLDYGSWLQHKYYMQKSQYLTEQIKLKNEAITRKLLELPKVSKLKSR